MTKSIGNKAAEFLRKAAAALRGKSGVLRARLLFLTSVRRRAAVLAGISRQIRALSPGQQGKKKAAGRRAMVLSRLADDGNERAATTPAGTRGGDVSVIGMAELARLFEEVDDGAGDGGRQDSTLALRSLFDDDKNGGVEGVEDGDVDEPSVIDLIRSRREGEGKEFRIDDEIDRAADMFITRVHRRRMSVDRGM